MRQSYLNILYYVIEYMCIYIRVIKLPVIMLNVRAVSGMALRPICRRPLTAYEGVLHFSAISKILPVFSCYMHRTFSKVMIVTRSNSWINICTTGIYIEISPPRNFLSGRKCVNGNKEWADLISQLFSTLTFFTRSQLHFLARPCRYTIEE